MVIDSIANIGRYGGLGANFETAVRYLEGCDLNALPMGKTVVDGDRVYINKSASELTGDCTKWEAHRRYADIQIIVGGRERFGWGTAGRMGELDESRDFMACYDVKSVFYDLTPGLFTIYLPEEPHCPSNFVERGEGSVKLVVKVLMA